MIYVDSGEGSITPPSSKFFGWCHLTSKDIKELHNFALKIGLKREWFHNHKFVPHYDVSQAKQKLAIKNGAKLVTAFEPLEEYRIKDVNNKNLK